MVEALPDSMQGRTTVHRRRLVVNVAHTHYDLVRRVLSQTVNGRLKSHDNSSGWDLLWTDSYISPETLAKMKPYQKVNRFPGMYKITRKNDLAKNLNKLRKLHPVDFNFYPRTWVLPFDLAELKQAGCSVYIVKPEAKSQGKGIFLTASAESFSADDRCVVQEYVREPLLLDKCKFDLRVYVLVTGCSPLRVFVHQEGLVRLATEPYSQPMPNNFDLQFMHLTNYAINKRHPVFTEGPTGYKRSLSDTLRSFELQGWDTAELWREIKHIIVKTLSVIQPSLAHTYRACQPKELTNSLCFELLGFDILIDREFKPWLLEVNHSPSFHVASALDESIKSQVLHDTVQLLHLDPNLKKVYLASQKRDQLGIRRQKQLRETYQLKAAIAKAERDSWERTHLGGFERINEEEFSHLLQSAKLVWEKWTGTIAQAPQTTPQSPLKSPPKVMHSRARSLNVSEPRTSRVHQPSKEELSGKVSRFFKALALERRMLGTLCPPMLHSRQSRYSSQLQNQRILFARFDPMQPRSARLC